MRNPGDIQNIEKPGESLGTGIAKGGSRKRKFDMNNSLDMLQKIMTAQIHKNDIVANNLANVSTNGFKKEVAFFDILNQNSAGSGVNVRTNFEQGPLKQTSNPLDMAIRGRGFFVVEADNGEALTRDGHFSVSNDGYLVNSSNHPLMGLSGRIDVPMDEFSEGDISINESGEIFVGDRFLDQIKIAQVDDPSILNKIGENLFEAPRSYSLSEALENTVLQGQLEGSNVNPVVEMVHLIELQRQFESSQRAMSALDHVLGKAASDISRYR